MVTQFFKGLGLSFKKTSPQAMSPGVIANNAQLFYDAHGGHGSLGIFGHVGFPKPPGAQEPHNPVAVGQQETNDLFLPQFEQVEQIVLLADDLLHNRRGDVLLQGLAQALLAELLGHNVGHDIGAAQHHQPHQGGGRGQEQPGSGKGPVAEPKPAA